MRTNAELKVLTVLNPGARAGRRRQDIVGIKRLVEHTFPDTTFFETGASGEALEMIKRQGLGFDVVMAAGGDGTINEITAALVGLSVARIGDFGADERPNQDRPLRTGVPALAILPMGTGNDLARTLGLSRNPRKALEQLSTAMEVRLDTGTVSWEESGASHRHVFINVVGVGLDALIAHTVHRQPFYKKLPRGLGYTAAILASLRAWQSPDVEITTLESPPTLLYAGPLMFTTVGNARYSGGGFCINPQARLRDGLIDACIVKGMSMPRALRLLPTVKAGSHVGFDEILYRHVEAIRIWSGVPLPIHCDGEVPSKAARDITIRVTPASLDVLVPSHRVEWI